MNKKLLSIEQMARVYFRTLYSKVDFNKHGDFEIRRFKPGNTAPQRTFCNSVEVAVADVIKYRDTHNIYTTINLGIDGHTKEDIKYLSTFHVDIDYGSTGHKKSSEYGSYEETLAAIKKFELVPTMVVHSGGGFHCYWILEEPVSVEKYGVKNLENINKAIIKMLNGDYGTKDITRILRVPGSINFKPTDDGKFRDCTIENISDKYYSLEQMQDLTKDYVADTKAKSQPKTKSRKQEKPISPVPSATENSSPSHFNSGVDVNCLNISQATRAMILSGKANCNKFESRSEFDLSVILALVTNAINDETIRNIFIQYPVGEKYREHDDPDVYLNKTIDTARGLIGLTPEQKDDPLFLSGSIKKVKDRLMLDITNFQTFICNKFNIVFSVVDDRFYRFDGTCYVTVTSAELNHLCQDALGEYYRYLLKSGQLREFEHFAKGHKLVNEEKYQNDKKRYLTFENCNFDYDEKKILNHSKSIFTTIKIPYSYDKNADCPRWMKFLDEIFSGDSNKINLVQEMVGYIYYPEIPTPALFFMVGSGANGKSVFLNTVKSLVGDSNTSSITLHKLCDEKYLTGLEGKLVNISMETPSKKLMEMDTVKSITSGDPVSARKLYKEVQSYTFYTKHFLAMNTFPEILDNSPGMQRRIYLIEFNRIFQEGDADVYLDKKLKKELPGILNWSLQGLRRLKENDFQFSISADILKTRNEYLEESNTVSNFMKSAFSNAANTSSNTLFKDVYDGYLNECNELDVTPLSKTKFKRTIINGGYDVVKSTKLGNQLCITGIVGN